jgi:DNA-nicking Smr family endonuclease
MTGSSRDRPPKRPAKAILAPEDASLWQRVAASIDSRRQGKPRVPDVESPPLLPSPARKAAAAVHRKQRPEPQTVKRPHNGAQQPPQARNRINPPTAAHVIRSAGASPAGFPDLDRRKVRRISSGSVEIEDRLDLHGLTQVVAHRRLVTFIQRAASKGMRTVLVITGKGAIRQPVAARGGKLDDGDTGILRRSVPRWLAEPPLQAMVLGCRIAAPRHGGEGAVYVLLRRLRRRESWNGQ